MKASQSILKDGWKKLNSFFLATEEETRAFAREFAKKLLPGDIILLMGDLGSGKTTFVKGLAEGLSCDEYEVCSPTFVYLNLYGHLAHFDLYRIESLNDFLRKGFTEYLEPPYIACIEWPNVIAEILPSRSYRVCLQYKGEGREIEIK